MPAFFFTTEEYIHGIVMANYTSGAPVRGNLTLKATIRPIRKFRQNEEQYYYDNNQQNYQQNYPLPPYYDPNYPNYNDYDMQGRYNRPVVEKYFNFVSFKCFAKNFFFAHVV